MRGKYVNIQSSGSNNINAGGNVTIGGSTTIGGSITIEKRSEDRTKSKSSVLVALIKLLTAVVTLVAGLVGVGAPTKYYIGINSDNVEKLYAITYDLGYSGANQLEADTASSKESLSLPVPEREGYDFKGWYLKEDKNTKILEMEDLNNFSKKLSLYNIFSNLFTLKKLNIDVELVAKWAPKEA